MSDMQPSEPLQPIAQAPTGRPIVWAVGIVLGFLIVAGAGASLLALPQATHLIAGKGYYFDDALFTSMSALTLTGLASRDTGAMFTPFGQGVILVLIQIGGLATMFFGTVLAVRLSREISLAFSPGEPSGRVPYGRIATSVVVIALVFELVGAAMLYPMFAGLHGTTHPAEAAWYALFHSVSAFCNAGLSLYPNSMMQGIKEGWLPPLREHWQVLGVVAPLVVIGGLGVPVLQDVWRWIISRGGRRLSLHTRLVVAMTLAMIVLGASGMLLIERAAQRGDRAAGAFDSPILGPAQRERTDWEEMRPSQRVEAAFFQAISARSGGFHTIDVSQVSGPGKLWLSGLMVVGASPGGTGGGMKTVTLGLLLMFATAAVCRRGQVRMGDRAIAADLLPKALAVAMAFMLLVFATAIGLALTLDPRERFMDVLFEACSACSSSGLTTGLSAKLTQQAKVVLTAAMWLGRALPLAMVFLMLGPARRTATELPGEGVGLG